MAKKSKVAQNEKRKETVARYVARRAELKEAIRRPSATAAEREAALAELHAATAQRQRHPRPQPRQRGRSPPRLPAQVRTLPRTSPAAGTCGVLARSDEVVLVGDTRTTRPTRSIDHYSHTAPEWLVSMITIKS